MSEITDAAPAGMGEGRVEAVNKRTTRSLYAKRIKIHPKGVQGIFRTAKWLFMIVLLLVYYGAPWLRWNRGPNAPDQAILIDFPTRKFYFFFIEIWPQEVYYLTGILIMMAIGLFALTSTVGRVWCGFACPQTVWTDLFIWVERMVEGDRNARIKLDRTAWGPEKIVRRVVKHAVWIVIAMATGGAWVFYFADAPTLAVQLATFQAPATAYITIGFLTGSTYLLAGFAREQVCTYMCPYARFQAAMLDEHSLIVTYRADRGEPRGKFKKGQEFAAGQRGDCVDCDSCVAACPTGIDIRDGQQLECINCGLCADACDAVMTVVGRPKHLIGLDTLANVQARQAGRGSQIKLIRPRVIVYIAVWSLVGLVMAVSLYTRANLKIDVLRDRNPLFIALAEGTIRNVYTFHVINKKHVDRQLVVTIDGLQDAAITVLNGDPTGPSAKVEAEPDSVTNYRVWVTAPRSSLKGESTDITFVLTDPTSKDRATYDSYFRGPAK